MTRDEYRKSCIEAMARALKLDSSSLFLAGENYWKAQATAAFGSLPTAGVRVVPIEATKEMIRAGLKVRPTVRETWDAMSAAGNLCNPPEGKS